MPALIRQVYQGTPIFDGVAAQGELTTNGSATAFPAKPGGLIRIKARSGNGGDVFIGDSTVTSSDNTSDNTTGLGLSPGEAEWFFVSPLSSLYLTGTNGDGVTFIVYNG